MVESTVIVWDLETVPDLKAAARMLGIDGQSDEQVRSALGSGFPKHPIHSIACIGALVAKREREGWRVTALGAPHVHERPEPELIRSFVDRIDQLRPQLVTFNGNGFDLPVLRYRAMLHRVEAAVTALRLALKERTFERVPLDWANTQINLGYALLKLAKLETGTDKLEQAVLAFDAGLSVGASAWPAARVQVFQKQRENAQAEIVRRRLLRTRE